jgi:hypothetical protein
MEARAGAPTTSPPALPLTFVGPGATLTQLTLSPLDSRLTQGDSLSMAVTGADANANPVNAFYVNWSSSDTNVARVSGAGVVRGRVPRGTVYIRARTPSTVTVPLGVVESTTVTLLPLPASLAKVGGDNQSAPVMNRLPLPLAVEVRAADNLPVPGVTVVFTVASGGGVLDSTVTTSDAAGVARTGVTLGNGLGAQTFTAAVAGAGSVTFTANASVTPTPTWTGTVSTDWHNGANWNLGAEPLSSDSVTIPAGTPNQPLVTGTNATVGALLNNGTLTLATNVSITAFGNVRGSGTIAGSGNSALVLAGPAAILDHASVPNVFVNSAAVTLARNITVNGALSNGGAGADINLGGHTATVTGDLNIAVGGTLTMNNAIDTLRVNGNVLFDGGDESGRLTAGVMFIKGNFTQQASSSPKSYAPSGAHLDIFNGTTVQTVSFATPGLTGSNWRTLVLANTVGGVTLTTDIQQSGPVAFANGVPRIVHGNGATVFVAELLANNVTLDNVLVAANNVLITQFDSITFQNYSPSATPLTISNPGVGSPFQFKDLKFQVVPTTGFYISVTDNAPADGVPFTVDLVNPTPGTGGAFIKTAGGAVVNWPAVANPSRMWTGAVDNNWSVAGNWSPALVPTNADDVIIPTATPVSPQLSTSCSAKTLTVVTGAVLNLNGINCQVQGNVFADGVISGPGNVQIQAAGLVRGNLPGLIVSAPVTVNGVTNITGSLTITGVGSKLTLNGNTVNVSANFATQGAGLLEMTSGADQLAIGGNASFDGGNELSHMSAGVLSISGSLNQFATSSGDSFHPSGTHLTILTGSSPSVGFATPGDVPGTSHFQELQWSGSGTLTLQSNVFAHGTFAGIGGTITKSGATSPTLAVGNLTNSALLTLNGVLLRINQPAGTPIALSNVSFAGTPGNAVALTVDHPGGAAAFTFANLTFSTVPSTGKYLVANDLNAADLQPLTLNLTNPTPGTSGGFVTVTGGAVVNWPFNAPAGITWTGAVSNDWFVGGNWTGGAVPNNIQHAIIPSGTPNQPVVLTGFPNIGSLTVDGLVDIAGHDLTVFGDVDGTGTMINSGAAANLVMSVGGSSLSLPSVPALRSNGGMVTLTGNVVVAGNIAIAGNGGLDLGAHLLVGGGNLSVLGIGATLVMTTPGGGLSVVGTTTFDGASEVGKLTQGLLSLGGDFTVGSTFTPTAFSASGVHQTVFTNAVGPQKISMAAPALVGGNHFGIVSFNSPGDYTLQGMPIIAEAGVFSAGNAAVVHGNGFRIQGATAAILGMVLDNTPLQVTSTISPASLIIDDVTFQNMSTTVDQLEIILPGAASAYTFNNLQFDTQPTTGAYVFATDNTADANVLTLNFVNPTPTNPGAFVGTSGGAVVVWPAVGGGATRTWDGSTSSQWSDPSNWAGNQVPLSGDNVVIPAGTPNDPVLDANVTLGDLTVSAPATLDNPDFGLTVNGDLLGGGTITGFGPNMSGTGRVIDISSVATLDVNGTAKALNDFTVTGDFNISGSGASFDVNSASVNVGGNFSTQSLGVLVMAHAADALDIAGSALFDGGNETGLLTGGVLSVTGDFTQAHTFGPGAFAASGTHKTILTGPIKNVTMADSTTSFFQNLQVSPSGAVVVFGLVTIHGNFILDPGVQLTGNNGSFTGDGLNVFGNVTTGAGSLLNPGRLYVGGTLSIVGTYGATAAIFTGAGQTAPSNLPYNFFYSNGTVTMAPGPFTATTLTVQGGALTLNGKTTVGGGGVFVTSGTLKPNNNTLTTTGSLNTQATGTLTMQNALDSVITTGTGSAFFGGGSTVGLLTAGVLKIAGNFVQTAGTSATSFAASGTHKTLLGAGGVKIINFATPGTGAAGSHFANLDVTTATGGLNLSNDIVADGALIAQPTGTAPTLTGAGKRVTAMSLSVTAAGTSLFLNNAPLIVNEQGSIRAQQFDRVSFSGYSPGATLMDMTMVGAAVSPRSVTFNGLALQSSGAGLYAKLVSSNSQFVTVTINGSDDPTGGPSKSNPSFGTTVNGARIVWQ